MIQQRFSSARVRVFVGLILASGLGLQAQRAWSNRAEETSPRSSVAAPVKHAGNVAFAAPARETANPALTLEARAAKDPLGVLQMALDRYDRSVRDYTCTFTKQELVNGKLTQEQVMRAMFREKPFSVRLEWTQNADKCSRVLYVADKWLEKGRQMAVVEPAGAIAQLFVSYVMRPIDGEDARKSSRRTIDQFGLRNSLLLTLKYCQLAAEKKILDLAFKGTSKIGERPTLVFERRLPYTGDDGFWPDRVLVVHLDRELLLPVLCEAFADDQKTRLLGRYQSSDIELNSNLPDATFTKEGMGL
ncbi:MAG: hypothetical protein AMXMBFR13_40330 [Phycisphaerae bacterium]